MGRRDRGANIRPAPVMGTLCSTGHSTRTSPWTRARGDTSARASSSQTAESESEDDGGAPEPPAATRHSFPPVREGGPHRKRTKKPPFLVTTQRVVGRIQVQPDFAQCTAVRFNKQFHHQLIECFGAGQGVLRRGLNGASPAAGLGSKRSACGGSAPDPAHGTDIGHECDPRSLERFQSTVLSGKITRNGTMTVMRITVFRTAISDLGPGYGSRAN